MTGPLFKTFETPQLCNVCGKLEKVLTRNKRFKKGLYCATCDKHHDDKDEAYFIHHQTRRLEAKREAKKQNGLVCCHCKELKPISELVKSSDRPLGFINECYPCRRKDTYQRKQDNPERYAYHRAYNKANISAAVANERQRKSYYKGKAALSDQYVRLMSKCTLGIPAADIDTRLVPILRNKIVLNREIKK